MECCVRHKSDMKFPYLNIFDPQVCHGRQTCRMNVKCPKTQSSKSLLSLRTIRTNLFACKHSSNASSKCHTFSTFWSIQFDGSAVLALGRIEWLHPGFHDEKRLWPVGYAAERVAATPASGNRPAPHRCEIAAASNGSGPVFRCGWSGHCDVLIVQRRVCWVMPLVALLKYTSFYLEVLNDDCYQD